jgi:hypothetical protein
MILKGGYMKRFKTLQVCLAFMMLILGVLITGCGSNGETGHWLPNESENVDATRPRVTVVVPAEGAQDVPINVKTVTAAFSEAMDPTTLTVASFTLWCDTDAGNTTQIQITGGGPVTYLDAGYVATLPLPVGANLPANVDCTATITSAATDVAGNQLAGNIALLPAASNFVWVFHTSVSEDTTAPSVISVYPADDSVDICVNTTISATFDEAMDPTTIVSATPGLLTTFTVMDTSAANADVPGIVTYDVGANIATFTPTNDLISGHVYTATITVAATDLAGTPLAAPEVWSFTAGSTFCQEPVALGATQFYGILSNTGVTLGGGGVTGFRVDGDVGIYPAGACVGCVVGPGGSISGVLENGTTPALDAMNALTAAYNDAIGRTVGVCTLVGSGDLTINPSLACGGAADGTFAPGLYWSSTIISIPVGGTITLDAKGDPNAVWIFQSESSIGSLANSHVSLQNGAQAKNVFWVGKSDATIGGVGADFAGTLIMLNAATVLTDTQMDGRVFARGAAITVGDQALITVPLP